jgi:hypothetical protein
MGEEEFIAKTSKLHERRQTLQVKNAYRLRKDSMARLKVCCLIMLYSMARQSGNSGCCTARVQAHSTHTRRTCAKHLKSFIGDARACLSCALQWEASKSRARNERANAPSCLLCVLICADLSHSYCRECRYRSPHLHALAHQRPRRRDQTAPHANLARAHKQLNTAGCSSVCDAHKRASCLLIKQGASLLRTAHTAGCTQRC